jgi:hypothetical protein
MKRERQRRMTDGTSPAAERSMIDLAEHREREERHRLPN